MKTLTITSSNGEVTKYEVTDTIYINGTFIAFDIKEDGEHWCCQIFLAGILGCEIA